MLILVQKCLPEAILSAMLSPASLCNCIELIKAWRSQLTPIELALELKDMIARLAASDKRVFLAPQRTWLATVWTRLAQYDMASDLDSKRQGAIRLDHAVYTKILVEEGHNVTPKARNQLKERVRKARKLFHLCQGFDRGLLCLLPFMEISENQLYNMTTAEIDEFHTLVAGKKLEIADRCKIGMSIQGMFTREVEFAFEAKNLPLSTASRSVRWSPSYNLSLIQRSTHIRLTVLGQSHRPGRGSGL
jgi:hypothetical protein